MSALERSALGFPADLYFHDEKTPAPPVHEARLQQKNHVPIASAIFYFLHFQALVFAKEPLHSHHGCLASFEEPMELVWVG
jgi:hypothetical protein